MIHLQEISASPHAMQNTFLSAQKGLENKNKKCENYSKTTIDLYR
jgi:hypothetical protein